MYSIAKNKSQFKILFLSKLYFEEHLATFQTVCLKEWNLKIILTRSILGYIVKNVS